MTLEALFTMFPALFAAVKKSHKEVGMLFGSGHDFHHTCAVANYALLVAPDERTAQLAAIAGLCHNADRILEKQRGLRTDLIPAREIEGLISYWLLDLMNGTDWAFIIDAVLKHSQPNDDRDSLVATTLKDADRLANADAFWLPRAGRFRPNIPVVHPDDITGSASSDFRNPRSILDDCVHVLEWFDDDDRLVCLRLPKAKDLGAPLARRLREWRNEVLADPAMNFMIKHGLLS